MSIEKIETKKINFEFDQANENDLEQINNIDNRPEEHADMLKLQKEGKGKFIVAKFNDKIAGYVFIYYDHQSFHFPNVHGPFLEDLMVHLDYRGQGLGKKLLKMCENEIANQGQNELSFAVLASNKQAIDFYSKNDFKRIPAFDFKTPDNEDSYYFKKEFTE